MASDYKEIYAQSQQLKLQNKAQSVPKKSTIKTRDPRSNIFIFNSKETPSIFC